MDEGDALRALRSCGVNDPESLLELATPDGIIATCNWWREQPKAGVGLLVHRLRAGGVDDRPVEEFSKQQQHQERFREYAARWPVGSPIETHVRLQHRCWPEDEPCVGSMMVYETTYPVIAAQCDVCEFERGYALRGLGQIPQMTGNATGGW